MATQVWNGSEFVDVSVVQPGEDWAGGGGVDQEALDAAVAGVVASAPGALDTLNELAAALGDDEDFAATVANALAAKLDAAAHSALDHSGIPGVGGY